MKSIGIPLLVVAAALVAGSAHTADLCPELVGRWPYGETGSVAVEGDFVYFDRGAVLTVADVIDPEVPTIVGEVALPSDILDLAVDEDLAFVLAVNSGLHIIDVADAANPAEVGWLGISEPKSVAADGSYVYVTNDSPYPYLQKLRVIDISTPSAPVEVGSIAIGDCNGIDVSAGLVFLAADFNGLRVIDATVPSAPIVIGRLFFDERARDVAVVGEMVVTIGPGDLWVVDVSSPSEPNVLAHRGFTDSWYHVAASGGLAFVTGDGLWVIDISDPTAPEEFGFVESQTPWGPVVVSEDSVIVAGNREGLRVMDVTAPDDPTEIAVIESQPEIERITVSESIAFAISTGGGLVVFDVSDPADPLLIGQTSVSGGIQDLAVAGDFVYLGHRSGLQVFYVAVPSNPFCVASLSFGVSFSPRQVEVEGDKVLASGDTKWDSYLFAVDVSVPAAPIEAGRIRLSTWVRDFDISENFAYVATHLRLQVLDIGSQPAFVEVGRLERPGPEDSIAVSGDRAYLNRHVLDVSDPSNPSMIGSYPNRTRDVEISMNGRLLVGAEMDGLRFINVTVPSNPFDAGFRSLHVTPTDKVVVGNLVFVPIRGAGFDVFDVSGCLPTPSPRRSGQRVAP